MTKTARRKGNGHWDALYERGLERCRRGEWESGLTDLAWVVKNQRRGLPALCYSYLGFGLARQGQVQKGIRYCRHAIKLEFFQPECYVNLARASLLVKGNRREAAEAVYDGLKIDPEYPELLELQSRIGARQPPVLRFLSRGHFFNRCLGWIRYQLTRPPEPAKPAESGERARPHRAPRSNSRRPRGRASQSVAR
jgi:hypothetical protein